MPPTLSPPSSPPAPPRPGAVRHAAGAALWPGLLAVASVAGLACSSLPFVPREGAGANLNLATVGYVQESQDEVREDLREELSESLPEAIDARLVEDRRRITRLQEGALARQEKMDALEQRLSEARAGLEAVADEMRREAEAFRSAASEMQALRQRLEDALRELPTRALEQLQLAIESHLAERGDLPGDERQPGSPRAGSDEDEAAAGG